MKVMCIAQTAAVNLETGEERHGTPKFGDVLTVSCKVYHYDTKDDYYFFEEYDHYPGGAMFQCKFFVPVEDTERY